MIIQHNIMALNAHRQLGGNNSLVQKNLEKLSSGYKINRAGDDAAGLAISEKMRAQITGLTRAQANAQDGISLVQTAEGALTEVHSMLNRMVDLSTQSANGTLKDDDRTKIQDEMDALTAEIDRISKATNFNGINLLDGSLSGGGNATADGTTLTGGLVAKFGKAELAGATITGDLSAATAGIDTFIVDGQRLNIDWKNDPDGVAMFAKLAVAHTGDAITTSKDLAKDMTNFFNKKMQEQGLDGSVKITSDGTNFVFSSNNTGKDSEFSYVGTQITTETTTAMGGLLFDAAVNGDGTTPAAGDSVTSKADVKYNGETVLAGTTMQVEVNGKKLTLTTGAEYTKGTTTMEAIAADMQTALQAAITQYNTDLGLTAGTQDPTTGLTGLTESDFTVEAKDGALVVKYDGDVEGVEFSFSDIGEKTAGASIGITGGGSAVGSTGGLSLQIGDTGDSFNKVTVSVANMSSLGLGVNNIDVGRQGVSDEALANIKKAITTVSTNRSAMGALQNRLEHTINNLGVTTENMTAAESRIRDVDMAKEMMHFTKNNVLAQAAQAMLAQANQQPQQVLQLLR